jgi:hypothetical protein
MEANPESGLSFLSRKSDIRERRKIYADDFGKGFVLDDLVTLTSGFFEARAVKDNDPAALIPDEPGLLKRSGDERDGCSAYSEHLGQKLLGQRK